MTEPKIGQIWREVDPRFLRYVLIEDILPSRSVAVRAVVKRDDKWIPAPRSRSGLANPARFNGKRGGYELHEGEP